MRVRRAVRIGKSSKAKGMRAELEVRDLIQEWWRRLEPECVFARTPSSGGWSAPSMRGEFKVAGDLTTTAERFPFTIEIKRREGWSEQRLRMGSLSPVWGWWGQVVIAAKEEDRAPMLWFRKSNEPWRVMFDRAVADRAGLIVTAVDMEWEWIYAMSVEGAPPIVIKATDLLAIDPDRFAR